MSSSPHFALVGAALTTVLAGCGSPALFPEDYRETYTEVRDCRISGDHDLNRVRVFADPVALEAYRDRGVERIPAGGILLKEEYDFGDSDCSGPILGWTVMQRLEDGEAPADLDWSWQRTDRDRIDTGADISRCVSCHEGCGVAPDGFDGTCAIP